MNRREYLVSAATAVTLASALRMPAAWAAAGEAAPYAPQIRYGVKIPMRDGVQVNATLYLPRGLEVARPTIFSLTPYTSDGYHPEGLAHASNGYPYLSVDMRGRGDSEGEFSPFVTDMGDGRDITDWIAKQPFCNGKVGMCGLSYVGYTQWGTVRGDPAGLATIVPSAPAYIGFDFPIRYNIFFNFAATWLVRTWGNTGRITAYQDAEYWTKAFLRFLESGLPFRKLTTFFGFESKAFDAWMEHPRQDEYWDQANPTPAQFAGLDMPVLSLCGAYDGDQLGTLEFHRQHLKHAGAKARHYLVIGPWDHLGVRKPKTEFGGITLGAASLIDMPKLHRDWYAWTMEGGKRPEFLKKKISYYVTVADKWRYADTLEGVTARTETLFLHASVNPTSVYNSGALIAAKPAARTAPGQFLYDPRDLSVPKLEATLTQPYLTDQTMVLAQAGGKLIYHSAPFEADTEVSGFFKFAAWIAIDTPDTDFNVSIYDIAPDGTSVLLTEQHMRARHREGLRTERLIQTREPLRYDFENFFFVSRLIGKDHRLRLVVRSNEGLGWQKNYNSGKPVVDETMSDARTVTVRLYQDAAHPSALSIPIGQPAA